MLFLLVKALILVILAIIIRGTLPRYRVDQLLNLNWKILIFIFITFFLNLLLVHSYFTL